MDLEQSFRSTFNNELGAPQQAVDRHKVGEIDLVTAFSGLKKKVDAAQELIDAHLNSTGIYPRNEDPWPCLTKALDALSDSYDYLSELLRLFKEGAQDMGGSVAAATISLRDAADYLNAEINALVTYGFDEKALNSLGER